MGGRKEGEVFERCPPVWSGEQLARALVQMNRRDEVGYVEMCGSGVYPTGRGLFAQRPLVMLPGVLVGLDTRDEAEELPWSASLKGGFHLRFTRCRYRCGDEGVKYGEEASTQIPLLGGMDLLELPRILLAQVGELEQPRPAGMSHRLCCLGRILTYLGRVELTLTYQAQEGPLVKVWFGFGWDLPGPGNGTGKYEASATVPFSTVAGFLDLATEYNT